MRKMLVLISISLILLTSCGPGSNLEVTTPRLYNTIDNTRAQPELDQADEEGQVAGLIPGLWHGIIAPVMLVGSFFNPAMQIYEVHNNGIEYNVGYLLGVAFVFLMLGVLGGRRR